MDLRTAYCTKLTPDVQDAAVAMFGAGALVAGTPNAAPDGPHATWPYRPETHEVVGLVTAHRSGPVFTVVRRKNAEARARSAAIVEGLCVLPR